MVKLTFYGGVKEIGGNKILLEHKDTKIFLDFGMSFNQTNKYFSEFLQPRKLNGIRDFIELKLLPEIDGIYRKDYLKHCGLEIHEKPFVDAVLISHAHADHAAYIHFLDKEIPIYCSKTSKIILQALEETGSNIFDDFINYQKTFAIRESKRKDGHFTKIKGDEAKIPRQIKILENNERIKIKDLEIEPVSVDHSLPGAFGYIIYTDEGNMVYTGDLRFHGRRVGQTYKFVKKAKEAKPKVMICEGTRINEMKVESEEDVRDSANFLISNIKDLAIVNIPIRDIDRLNTFYLIAKDTNRLLTINLKQAYLLKLLEENGILAPRLNDRNIRIYIPRKTWGLILRDDYPENIKEQDYSKWEREFLKHKNVVTYEDIKNNQSNYIFQCNFFEIKELIDIQPKKGSSCYIRSICEPFNEEMEIDMKKVENWLEHFGLLPIYQIHASGHAPGKQLFEMIREIKPEVLIPVHTEYPGKFRVPEKDKIEVRIVKEEKIYII